MKFTALLADGDTANSVKIMYITFCLCVVFWLKGIRCSKTVVLRTIFITHWGRVSELRICSQHECTAKREMYEASFSITCEWDDESNFSLSKKRETLKAKFIWHKAEYTLGDFFRRREPLQRGQFVMELSATESPRELQIVLVHSATEPASHVQAFSCELSFFVVFLVE